MPASFSRRHFLKATALVVSPDEALAPDLANQPYHVVRRATPNS